MPTVTITALTQQSLDRAMARDTIVKRGDIALSLPTHLWPTSTASAEPSPWRHLIASGVRVIVVNPADGPGASSNAAWSRLIVEAQARGVVVLGYVRTASEGKAQASVQAEIDSWITNYPTINGIMLGEVLGTSTTNYYQSISSYIKSKNPAMLTCFESGKDMTVNGLYDQCDIALTFNDSASTYLTKTFVPDQSRISSKQWHCVYGASADQVPQIISKARDLGAHHLSITSATGASPFDSIPPDAFLDAVNGRASQPVATQQSSTIDSATFDSLVTE